MAIMGIGLKKAIVVVVSALGILLFIHSDSSVSRFLLEAENSATGSLFHGEQIREYEGDMLFGNDDEVNMMIEAAATLPKPEFCSTKWNVVTTIHEPSLAVQRAVNMEEWCTVIVADTKTPIDYLARLGVSEDRTDTHFLSVEQQMDLMQGADKFGDFVDAIPLKHFARKNIGYLYAIQHGAKFIFDFDDDNVIDLLDVQGNAIPIIPNPDYLEGTDMILMTRKVWNPYPMMNASVEDSWPRGFPLEQTLDETTRGTMGYQFKRVPMDQIGVMQFVADGNPDIDAVHRMTKPLPMYFKRRSEGGTPVVAPLHAFVPYNAQATIHAPNSLWATLLPASVPGRVSDIWRSYFAEAIFRDYNLRVAFLPPQVSQVRNEHNLIADMDAEEDLYQKTTALVDFLNDWVPKSRTVPGKMEELWIELFERGYIEESDVRMVQLWLGAVIEAGYEFHLLKPRERHHNVVLMGQFNYEQDVDQVKLWAQKWKEIFSNIEVVGPFSHKAIDALRSNGITAYAGASDRGMVSPMANLRDALMRQKYVERIEGVLYIHDDGMLNMTDVLHGQYPFPNNGMMISDNPSGDTDLPSVYTIRSDSTFANHHLYSYQGKEFERIDKPDTIHHTVKNLIASLQDEDRWGWKACVPNFAAIVRNDKRMDKFKDADGHFGVPHHYQSDFLFVPTRYADAYIEAANIMIDHYVYLECGIPTILKMMRMLQPESTLDFVSLCTKWGEERGQEAMVETCRSEKAHGLFHPLKVSRLGIEKWDTLFDEIKY